MAVSRSYPRHLVKFCEKRKSIKRPLFPFTSSVALVAMSQGFPRVTTGYQSLPHVTKGYHRLPQVISFEIYCCKYLKKVAVFSNQILLCLLLGIGQVEFSSLGFGFGFFFHIAQIRFTITGLLIFLR